MGQELQTPAGQDVAVINPNISTDAQRVADAGARAKNAVERALASEQRILAARARIEADPPTDVEPERTLRVSALALVNHQRTLAAKHLRHTKDWARKSVRRVEKFENNGAYESLVKAIRYAHLAEKQANLVERQAYWADYYTVDNNRAQLTNDGGGE